MKNSSNFLYVLAKQCWSPFNSTDFFFDILFHPELVGTDTRYIRILTFMKFVTSFSLSWLSVMSMTSSSLVSFGVEQTKSDANVTVDESEKAKDDYNRTRLFNWSNCSIVVSGSPIVAQVRRKKRYCVVIFTPIIVAIILEWWRRIFYKQTTFAWHYKIN